MTQVVDVPLDPSRKRIVVCGYPKSGNTWLTRLVGDMLDCPVVGYLRGEQALVEEVSEGQDRISDHEVYKSHLGCAFLARRRPIHAFIYVLRDPRDVVCSGAHFFDVAQFHEHYGGGADRYKAMALTLLRGGVYPGCKLPWRDHVRQAFPANVCMVRYEDLLASPVQEMSRIAEFLGRSVAPSRIEATLERQSFSVSKKQEAEAGKSDSSPYLRRGVAGAYRDELSPELTSMIETELRPELEQFGYLDR